MEMFPEIIQLNVGGKHLSTRLSTLTKYPDSMLAAMFSGRHVADMNSDGRYLVDCNGDIFELILDFLRFGSLPSKEKAVAVYEMSVYFVIQPLMQALESFQEVRNKIKVDTFKGSAAAKEYESLKQKITAALDSSRPSDTKIIQLTLKQGACTSKRTCSPSCFYSFVTNTFPSADIQIEIYIDFQPSEDFIFCLKEDLCRFGFGSHCRAYGDTCITNRNCESCNQQCTLLLLILSQHKLVTAERKKAFKFV